MDQSVLDAIERWPNVPAVYGWLSLSRRGQWRLHPSGTASDGGFGESIQNQQILSFMDRNYASDNMGQWFFQNGPQRVFVRLDAAPLIVSVTGQPSQLMTHNGLPVQNIHRWIIDASGNLFLSCEHGAGCILDQDLELVMGALQTDDGTPLLEWWDQNAETVASTIVIFNDSASFSVAGRATLELLGPGQSASQALGFVTNPTP